MNALNIDTQKPDKRLSVLVIGVGNPHHHDEQAGLYAARRLREKAIVPMSDGKMLAVREVGGDVFDLIDSWHDAEMVLVIDAVTDGHEAGTVHYFEVCKGKGCPEQIPADLLLTSSHGLSLDDIVSLALSLGKLPPRLAIYSIEVEHIEPGEGLSLPVLAAAERVVSEILDRVLPDPHGLELTPDRKYEGSLQGKDSLQGRLPKGLAMDEEAAGVAVAFESVLHG
jgi:hydrogenase maturation protease